MRNHKVYRSIYRDHFGPIPKGYQIHHIDGNYENNDISNLECLSPKEHALRHPHMMNFVSAGASACKKGGKTQGDKNKKSGHWAKISELGRTKPEALAKKRENCIKNKSGFYSDTCKRKASETGKKLKREARGIFSKESRKKIETLLANKIIGWGSYTAEERLSNYTSWLEKTRKENPELLIKLNSNLQRHSKMSRMFLWLVTNTDLGIKKEVINLTVFCKKNGLSVGTLRLTETGIRKSHKGWVAHKLRKITTEEFDKLDGELYYENIQL